MTVASPQLDQAYAVLLEFIERYGPKAGEEGPVLFMREVLGLDPDPWQEEVLRAYGRGEPRMAIKACHGPGKTLIAAVEVIHSLCCRFPQHSVATAPSVGQLEKALVKEVMILFSKLPELVQELFEVKKNAIELRAAPEESWFSARTARAEKPEALQGIHCEGGFVLLIGDEASGIDNAIFESAAGSMSGANTTTLLLSNPVRGSGFFFDCFHRNADMWWTRTVAAHDSPRVTDEFVRYIGRQFGEDSSAFRIRVLGEFPKSDDDTVIPLELVQSARDREIVVVQQHLGEVWGLDVARFGDDLNVLARRTNIAVLPDIDHWGGLDTMETTGRVKAAWDRTQPHLRPQFILVDVIGVGAGVVDRLKELNVPVRGVNVGETRSLRYPDKYLRLRDELWFLMKDWLVQRDVVLPKCEGGCARDCPHERLASELTIPRFRYSSSGKMEVEPKQVGTAKSEGGRAWGLRNRGFKSPNFAEAVMLTFAVGASGIIHGGRSGQSKFSWKKPLRRGRSMV